MPATNNTLCGVPKHAFPPLVAVVALVTIIVSLSLRLSLDPGWSYSRSGLPFLSDTGVEARGRAVFGVGMTLTAMGLALVMWLLWKALQRVERRLNGTAAHRASPGSSLLRVLNTTQAVLGLFSGLMLALLSIVSLDVSNDAHNVFALLFFATGTMQLLAVVFFVWTERHLRKARGIPPADTATRLSLRAKTVLLVLVCVAILASLVVSIIGYSRPGDYSVRSTPRGALMTIATPLLQYFYTLIFLANMALYATDIYRGREHLKEMAWDRRKDVHFGPREGLN